MRLTEAGSEHAVTRAMEDFDVHTEQYWVLPDGLIEVLADCVLVPGNGDEWPDAVTMPVVWTRRWGKGRIFTTSLGHTVDVLKDPAVRPIVERGMLWASR